MTTTGIRWTARAAALLLLGVSTAASSAGETDGGRGLFLGSVRAILTESCLSCHAADVRKGGLDLSRAEAARAGGENGPAIEPGRADESLLYEKVAAGAMPPKDPLRPEQVAALRAWIDAGAAYDGDPLAPRRAGPDWWSLRPIARGPAPTVKDRTWPRTPIDADILAALEAKRLRPAPEADRPAYIRRVTFDLNGLPPTPAEVAAFVEDTSEHAYETLVDHLLASPAYGERWARHWLDVVRFAESHGYETNNLRPNAWPYRDYIIRAFNDDIPFARFVADQIAGDALPGGDWLAQSATGFLVGGAHDVVGNQTPAGMLQQRADDLDDMIVATSTAFLGLTVGCARCHDHKFDPITQRDYYAMQALLAGVRHADREVPAPDVERREKESAALVAELARIDRALDEAEPLARPDLSTPGRPRPNSRRNVERFTPVSARSIRFTVRSTGDGLEPCLDELEVWTAGPGSKNVAAGAKSSASSTYPNSNIHRLEHINDGRYGNGRSWISGVPGKGWVRLDWPEPAAIDRVVWGRDRDETYRDRTPADYEIEAADAQGHWRVVASSADRGAAGPGGEAVARLGALEKDRAAIRARLAGLRSTISVYSGTFDTPGPTHLLLRGDPTRKGEPVAPGGLASVRPGLTLAADTPEPARRLALAQWIADPANPLAARVMVNRAWHYHFGRGIVGTPSDFGFNGEAPTHPGLLDRLAAAYLDNGGHLKPIHRMIMLSAAYRQSSRFDPKAAAIDAGDRLLWRFPPRRLEAEEIRDAILAISGALDRRMGGPGYSVWEPNTNYVVVFKPRDDPAPDTFRRMIYAFNARSRPDPTFGAFDCPDGGLIAPRRNASTTALQALNLLNSRFVLNQSTRLADRLRLEAGPEPAAQARLAFRLAFGRDPIGDELIGASALVRDHGATSLARALFNASEFLHVP